MTSWLSPLSITAYIVAQMLANLAFGFASQKTGMNQWMWFILGNALGFPCTFLIVLALRHQNPNLVYALCLGGGFLALQIASSWIFRVPLGFWQWIAVALITLGMVLFKYKA